MTRRRGILFAAIVALAITLLVPSLGTGQSPYGTPGGAAPSPLDRVPAWFSVAGPVERADRRLDLVTGQRSCGFSSVDPPVSTVDVTETEVEVRVRVEVAPGRDGQACESPHLIRLPVRLGATLGTRTIVDAGADPPGPADVLPFDPIETGFRYTCDGWDDASVATLVGPGLELGQTVPRSSIPDARAMVDVGDAVEYIGRWSRRGAAWEGWWLADGLWRTTGTGGCWPRAVFPPGLSAAMWTLRGPRPSPSSRRIRIWVHERDCASGQPPVGRVARPLVQIHRGAIVVIMATLPLGGPWQMEGLTADGGPYAFVDCQGAPAAPYTASLPVRLGSRVLYDGSVFPPRRASTRQRSAR